MKPSERAIPAFRVERVRLLNDGERVCKECPILLIARDLGFLRACFPVEGSGTNASGSKKKRILSPEFRK